MESVTIFCKKSRSQKLTVKGGFYSREDMRTELKYTPLFSSTATPNI